MHLVDEPSLIKNVQILLKRNINSQEITDTIE